MYNFINTVHFKQNNNSINNQNTKNNIILFFHLKSNLLN